jgi:hypothetical protein
MAIDEEEKDEVDDGLETDGVIERVDSLCCI